jgi:hypothetical protein
MTTPGSEPGLPEDDFEDYDGYDEVCGDCGGDGYVLNDCFEDTCCCADPESEHGLSVCPTCKGGRK